MLVGARYHDETTLDAGSAYIYRFDGSSWNEEFKLHASDPQEASSYGWAVTIENNTVAVVARIQDDIVNGTGAGAVYVYDLGCPVLCSADVTTQGAGSGDPGFGAPDGLVTGADINYYVNLWVAGCP